MRDKLLLIREVCDILRCSERTIYRLIKSNELPGLKVRGSLRIRESALETYVQKQAEFLYEENV